MVLAKLFGTKSERETKKLVPLINEINQFYETLSSKSDEDLVNRTHEMREIVINARVTKKESSPENINVIRRLILYYILIAMKLC